MKLLSSLFFLILFSIMLYHQWQLHKIREDIQVVYNRQSLRDQKYRLEESEFVKTAKNSVVILRCTDKTTPQKAWLATATKVHPTHITTVFHSISPYGNNNLRTYPIHCLLTQEGIKVGEIKIISDKEAWKMQIAARDLAIVPVNFNDKGKEIPILVPTEVEQIAVGDVIALVSSPAKFHLDAVVSFGVVLAKKIKHSLKSEHQSLWEDAISSDVIAFGGSSGGALLHFNPSPAFIGLHVGNNGNSTNGTGNLYLAYYQLLFDQDFFLKYNSLP